MNNSKYLTVRDSNVLKGIGICLLLWHHLFYDRAMLIGVEANTVLRDWNVTISVAQFFKICVALFVFVTAYGMSYKLEQLGSRRLKLQTMLAMRQIVKLWFSFVPVYLVILCTVILAPQLSVELFYGTGEVIAAQLILDLLGLSNLAGTYSINQTWWYVTFLFALQIFIPIYFELHKRYGSLGGLILAILTALMCQWWGFEHAVWYGTSAMLAIVMQQNGLPSRNVKRYTYVLNAMLLLVALYLLYMIRRLWGWWFLVDNVAVFCVVLLEKKYLSRVKLMATFFETIGKNSLNIFLIHTFFYAYLFRGFVYSLKWDVLIWAGLLILSLLFSYGMEWLKGKVHYMNFIDKCLNVIEKKMEHWI